MNVSYKISCTNKGVTWSENTVSSKLEAIGNLKGKKVAWIQSDLSVKKSNCLTRLIWSVVAKHFTWMRKHFYGVDLHQSRSLLEEIGNQVKDNPNIKDLYDQTVGKFNQIAPRHKLAIERESIPLTSVGNVEKKPLISETNLQIFGPTVWKEYLGLEIKGEIPPLPNNIVEEVKALRESIKGKKEVPKCTLVFIPKGLTANKLIELMKAPQKGHSTKLDFIASKVVYAYGDKENEESYWFLMTNDVIEGSTIWSYNRQKNIVKNKTNGKCELPTYLEALVGCAMHHVKNGEHMLAQKFRCKTYCQDLRDGKPIIVGGEGRLCVVSHSWTDDHCGALAVRKFC